MDQVKIHHLAGIDLGSKAVQLSILDLDIDEMKEFYLPLEDGQGTVIERGLRTLSAYMKENDLKWDQFLKINFSLEEASDENRRILWEQLGEKFIERFECHVITRFRAFAEFIFHQDRVQWERNTVLFDYTDGKLTCTSVDQITRSKQKAFRSYMMDILLGEYGIQEEDEEKDLKFSKMMKQFLAQHPTQMIYLTGKGFEGNWMKKTLNCLCSGRRVFLGQNLYANGACYMGECPIPIFEEGLVLMSGPDMVQHTIGVVTSNAGKAEHTPITTIGHEWYNTKGSIDLILDKSKKIEFFYHNAKENMMEGHIFEMKALPNRPAKATRVRVHVSFTSALEGVIMLQDLGFGSMFPATDKVELYPFSLIS